MTTRRRFLQISAAALGFAAEARASSVYRWSGVAMGAEASIRLSHPDAEAITARAAAEISRLEDVFSLYRAGSALSRLNRDGMLDAPPFELLECLSLAGRVFHASGGLFDPTVQRLWQVHAEAALTGRPPEPERIAAALAVTGWGGVALESGRIALRPGMALTLNGIAQGYVADRVTTLLEEEGLTNILVDTGELRALGGHPDGGGWPVRFDLPDGRFFLRDMAVATSAPLGTVLDAAGKVGHIIDPRVGSAAGSTWRSVSVTAPSAAVADALSTAACLCAAQADIARMVGQFDGARVLRLVA